MLILLLIAVVLDLVITKELKKSQDFAIGESYIWKSLFNGEINSDIVIYGSSRAWVHINPVAIENSTNQDVYNLGVDGHNFWIQYLRHKVLIEKNKKPKKIIISIGPFTLSKRSDLYNYEQFLPYIFNKDVRKYTKSFKGLSILDYYLPLFRYRNKTEEVKEIIKANFQSNSVAPYRIKGYRGMERSWNNDLKKAKAKLDKYKVKFDNATENLFEDFIKECDDLNIELAIVYTPEYVEGQKFIENREEVITHYKDLAEKYNLHFLDYSKDSISSNKALFYNSLHMNKKGSNLFSNKLTKNLKDLKFL